jgi:hypothetical protein
MAVSAAVAWKRAIVRPGSGGGGDRGARAALGSLTIMPIGPLGLTPHQMNWLWRCHFVVLALVLALIGAARTSRCSVPGDGLSRVRRAECACHAVGDPTRSRNRSASLVR